MGRCTGYYPATWQLVPIDEQTPVKVKLELQAGVCGVGSHDYGDSCRVVALRAKDIPILKALYRGAAFVPALLVDELRRRGVEFIGREPDPQPARWSVDADQDKLIRSALMKIKT